MANASNWRPPLNAKMSRSWLCFWCWWLPWRIIRSSIPLKVRLGWSKVDSFGCPRCKHLKKWINWLGSKNFIQYSKITLVVSFKQIIGLIAVWIVLIMLFNYPGWTTFFLTSSKKKPALNNISKNSLKASKYNLPIWN